MVGRSKKKEVTVPVKQKVFFFPEFSIFIFKSSSVAVYGSICIFRYVHASIYEALSVHRLVHMLVQNALTKIAIRARKLAEMKS